MFLQVDIRQEVRFSWMCSRSTNRLQSDCGLLVDLFHFVEKKVKLDLVLGNVCSVVLYFLLAQ